MLKRMGKFHIGGAPDELQERWVKIVHDSLKDLSASGVKDDLLELALGAVAWAEPPKLSEEAEEALLELPPVYADELRLYVLNGVKPGRLVCATIDNNLQQVVEHLGSYNLKELQLVSRWVWEHVPKHARGSRSNRAAWQKEQRAATLKRMHTRLTGEKL